MSSDATVYVEKTGALFGIVYSLSRSIRQQGEHRTRLGLFTRYQERLLRGISFGGSLSAETSPNGLGVGGC